MVQQNLFGDHFDITPKKKKIQKYPFNTKNVLNNHYERFLKVVKAGAEYASKFDNKTIPYLKGTDEHGSGSNLFFKHKYRVQIQLY